MYGAQTANFCLACPRPFENDVEMYGAQTEVETKTYGKGLRMM